MRVISGKYRGKKLDGFNIDGTRPTMDRVKESIFSVIRSYLKGASVLDLFAGSGALGIEAISNGAKKCVLVDNNEKAVKVILENIKTFDDDFKVINSDYKRFLKNTENKFDVIFLDPPYRADLMNKALKIIWERDLLNEGGIIICEYEIGNIDSNYEIFKTKKYRVKNVVILRK